MSTVLRYTAENGDVLQQAQFLDAGIALHMAAAHIRNARALGEHVTSLVPGECWQFSRDGLIVGHLRLYHWD